MAETLAPQMNVMGLSPDYQFDAAEMAAPLPEVAAQADHSKRNVLVKAGAVLLCAATFASFGHTSKAEAADTGAPVVGTPEITSSVSIAKSTASVESLAAGKVAIMGNMKVNGLPKKEIRNLEKQGKCKVLDGSEVDIWTQGHYETGKPYGKDTRTSEFCKKGKDWVRVACGNIAKFTIPKDVVKAPIIWVKNYAKAKMTLNAHAAVKAEAYCKTENTYAYAMGFGEADASEVMSVKSSMKAKGRGFRKVVANIYGKITGRASAKASASAVAECHDQGGQVVPKDGTQGQGTITPGQPGGPGAGGEAGNPTTVETTCFDTPDSVNGDLDPATSGDVMYGKRDQFYNCVGPAEKVQ